MCVCGGDVEAISCFSTGQVRVCSVTFEQSRQLTTTFPHERSSAGGAAGGCGCLCVYVSADARDRECVCLCVFKCVFIGSHHINIDQYETATGSSVQWTLWAFGVCV